MRALREKLILPLILLLAILYRLDYLTASNFVIDADEAIVGLMARHINAGEPVPAFYYGQHYMGSFEAIVAAAFFKLFGANSMALKLVPSFFSVIFVLLLYALTLEFAGIFAARAAALLAALPPAALLEWGCRARGGFIEVLLIGGLSLLCISRFLRSNGSMRAFALAAFLLGFGWWVNNQIIYFAIPAALAVLSMILSRHHNRLRYAGSLLLNGAALFFLGSLPFWFYNLQHSFASFGLFRLATLTEALQHAAGVFSTSLPILLGARRFWSAEDVYPGAIWLTGLFYGGLLLFLLLARREEILPVLRLRFDGKRPLALPVLLVVAAIFVFVSSSFGYLVQAPRYLLPVYVGLFPLIGCALELFSGNRRWLGKLILMLLLGINLVSFYLGGRAIPGEPLVVKGQRVSKDHAELIAWLNAGNYKFVRTNYWIGYRLAFESEERVRFGLFGLPAQVRIPEWEKLVSESAADVPLVLVPAQTALVTRAFMVRGIGFEKRRLSGYDVLYAIKPSQGNLVKLAPSEINAQASEQPEAAGHAVDEKLETRWGSGRAQTPGMTFSLELPVAQPIRGLSYNPGQWKHDYPRGLKIELELVDGQRSSLLQPRDYEALRYVEELYPEVSFYFPPAIVRRIIFTQTGSDPVFDWSLAEVAVAR
jgi:4-amino-4-deoxy-L-arabinose transferase-like glycosyltransferase